MTQFVSRAGEKLQFALDQFKLDVTGKVAADFGSSTGGFVDCLLQNGVKEVYAVEVGYGTIDWKLRNDPRVVVMERTNAMHVTLPEKVDVITIDCGWTKQEKILPNALKNLKTDGCIISLIKPHYEAPELVRGGKLPEELVEEVVERVIGGIREIGVTVKQVVVSPIVGEKGGNREYLALLEKDCLESFLRYNPSMDKDKLKIGAKVVSESINQSKRDATGEIPSDIDEVIEGVLSDSLETRQTVATNMHDIADELDQQGRHSDADELRRSAQFISQPDDKIRGTVEKYKKIGRG